MARVEIGEPNLADPNWNSQYWSGFFDNHSYIGIGYSLDKRTSNPAEEFLGIQTDGSPRYKIVFKAGGLNPEYSFLLAQDFNMHLSLSPTISLDHRRAWVILKTITPYSIFKRTQAELCLAFQVEKADQAGDKDPISRFERLEKEEKWYREVQVLNAAKLAQTKYELPEVIPFPYIVGLLERCLDPRPRSNNPNRPIASLRLPSKELINVLRGKFGGGYKDNQLGKEDKQNIRDELVWASGQLRNVLEVFQPYFRLRYIAEIARLSRVPNSVSWDLLRMYHTASIDLAIDDITRPTVDNEDLEKERKRRFSYLADMRDFLDGLGLSGYRQQIDQQANRLPKSKSS